MRPLPLALAAIALALCSSAAPAQGVDSDVRCLLVSNVFATKETDAPRKQLAAIAVAFYLGRVDARLQPAQVRASVVAIGKEKIGVDIGRTMTNCAKAMQAKQVATAHLVQDIARTQVPAAAVKK